MLQFGASKKGKEKVLKAEGSAGAKAQNSGGSGSDWEGVDSGRADT